MDEYISRENVLKAFKLIAKNQNKDYQRGMQDTIDCLVPEVIADIPSADVQPVEHGRCVIDNEDYERCSVCNEHETGMRYFTFCPRCGAKLDGDTE